MTDTTELRRLHGAATQGEWFQPDGGDGDVWNGIEVGQLIPDRVIVQGPHKPSWVKTRNNDQWIDENARNLAAIVAIHNAAPALFDAADRLARVEAVLGSEEAVEQVALRMLAAELGTNGDYFDHTWGHEREAWMRDARAAIAALVAMMGEG
jgi:hypothetical protein